MLNKKFKISKSIKQVFLTIFVILLPAVIIVIKHPQKAEAVWFNDAWHYRYQITFTNTGSQDSDKKVLIDMDTSSLITNNKLQSDCDDSRFTDVNGNPLPYYLDAAGGACNTNSTDYYVLLNVIPKGTNVLYYYYGNPNAFNMARPDQFSQSTFTPNTGPTIGSEGTGNGPAVWLRFDEGVDNTCTGGVNDTCDQSSNKNDGAISNGAAWKNDEYCAIGKCLFFDGSDDVVTVTNANSIDFDIGLNKGITYSFWIKPLSDGEGDTGQVFNKGTNNYCRTDSESNGAVDLECNLDLATTDANLNLSGALTLNQWHHVAMGYTDDADDEISVFVDGNLMGISTNGVGSPAGTDTSDLLIGGSSSANFHGFIDEFKIYPYQRSIAQIKTDSLVVNSSDGAQVNLGLQSTKFLSDGLVGYWTLDSSSGTAADSSGTGYTLTNNGTTTYVTGKFGNGSEHVPASSQYLSTASTLNNIKTLSFWVNPDSTTNYYISLTASAYITSTSGTLTATGFTNPTIYVNGVQSNTVVADVWQLVTVTTPIGINANTFYIGRQGSNYFDGTMDEVRVYNKALLPEDVAQLYKWAPGPTVYYKFDDRL